MRRRWTTPVSAESALKAPMSDGCDRTGGRRSDVGLAAYAFLIVAIARHWLLVFPRVRSELRHWRRSAARIRDPAIRRLALEALQKRGDREGVAAFAAFVRFGPRRDVVQALVAFETIYSYVEMLADQQGHDSEALHEVLLLALEPGAASPACRADALRSGHDDDGYLAEMIEACRWAVSRLPGFPLAAPYANGAARRIVTFQSLAGGDHGELKAWALHETPAGSGFDWWETAAAARSSLAVHALIAASASSSLSARDIAAIDSAYSPSICALHSLLDSAVNEAADVRAGQLSLIGYYRSPQEAAVRLGDLTERTINTAKALPDGRVHAILTTAMACTYLGDLERADAPATAVAVAVRASFSRLLRPVLGVFAVRWLVGRPVLARRAGQAARVAEARAGDAALPVR